jgi:hypothetical protein
MLPRKGLSSGMSHWSKARFIPVALPKILSPPRHTNTAARPFDQLWPWGVPPRRSSKADPATMKPSAVLTFIKA